MNNDTKLQDLPGLIGYLFSEHGPQINNFICHALDKNAYSHLATSGRVPQAIRPTVYHLK